MKRINYIKHLDYMIECIKAKYSPDNIVWQGENRFIIIKNGEESRVSYQ